MKIMKIIIFPLCWGFQSIYFFFSLSKFPCFSIMYNFLSVSKGNYPNLAIECRTMCLLSSFCSQLFHIFPPNTSLLIRLGIICALRKLLVPPWGNFSDRFYEEAFSARPCWKNNFWHSHPCKKVLGSAAGRLSLIWLWGLHVLPPMCLCWILLGSSVSTCSH